MHEVAALNHEEAEQRYQEEAADGEHEAQGAEQDGLPVALESQDLQQIIKEPQNTDRRRIVQINHVALVRRIHG